MKATSFLIIVIAQAIRVTITNFKKLILIILITMRLRSRKSIKKCCTLQKNKHKTNFRQRKLNLNHSHVRLAINALSNYDRSWNSSAFEFYTITYHSFRFFLISVYTLFSTIWLYYLQAFTALRYGTGKIQNKNLKHY